MKKSFKKETLELLNKVDTSLNSKHKKKALEIAKKLGFEITKYDRYTILENSWNTRSLSKKN